MSWVPLRILYVHNGADLYGASRCLARLLASLDKEKFKPIVVLPEEGPLKPMLEGLSVEVIVHPQMSVIARPIFRSWKIVRFAFRFPLSVFFMYQLMRRKRIALVHTNTGVIISPALAAWLAGAQHVWHIREWFGEFRSVWSIYSWYITTFSRKVLAISHAVAEQFEKSQSIEVIHDGLAEEEFDVDRVVLRREFRAQYGLSEEAIIVGCVGRIKWVRKGQEYLIQAASLLHSKGYNDKYLFVGSPFPGNEDHLARLHLLVRELNLEQKVVFTGDLLDTRPAYAAMDIMVLPSANPEPFGMVVTEAMAMGLPVIATNFGGPVDQVIDGVSGFLVPPGNPGALADKLQMLLHDANLRKLFGEAGRKRATTNFTLNETARRIERVYDECLT